MPSNTKITRNRRKRKARKLGRDKKKARTRAGTPKFPIHPQTPSSEPA
ncbi:MAG: hypothetical protein NZ898_06420 [Myxococcota bacterium]|nr:hypothetical protein [Myxococcota bacterium]MDW8362657.1 hypothetical protein [Myxococcales bacterium]